VVCVFHQRFPCSGSSSSYTTVCSQDRTLYMCLYNQNPECSLLQTCISLLALCVCVYVGEGGVQFNRIFSNLSNKRGNYQVYFQPFNFLFKMLRSSNECLCIFFQIRVVLPDERI